MKHGMPSIPNLRRSVEKFSPKVEIVIVCEGTVTEPDYFKKCVEYYGAGLVRLRVVDETGVPLTVVRAAVREKSRLTEIARKSNIAPSIPFSVWAVFDRDEHDVDEALRIAHEEKIGVAFSNPCFELWPLLHLINDYGSQDGRHDLQRRLHTVMPKYHHENDPRIDFELIRDRLDAAFLQAERLNKARRDEGDEIGCPSTTVGVLTVKVKDNGRMKFKSR